MADVKGPQAFPGHLAAQFPIIGQKLPPEGVAWYVEQLLPALLRDRRMAGGCTVDVDKDQDGWTVRIDLPKG